MTNANNKITTGRNSSYETTHNYKHIVIGEVVSVGDVKGLGRIKVRVKGPISLGGDDGVLDKDLPWCFPLMPKMFSIQPKPKESVYLLNFGREKQHVDRMYLGPIISQPQKLNFDAHYGSALAAFSFGTQEANIDVNTIPEILGVFPNPSDVSIEGRDNTDMIHKNNEILIRAGKFISSTPSTTNPYPFKFNKTTQGYIQIKGSVNLGGSSSQKGSVTNVISNKINLLTHEGGSPRYNITNQNNLISDEELGKILSSETEGGAHRLPFGDVLLEYLRLLKNALYYHVHNGNGNSATDLTTSGNIQALAAFKAKADDLEKAMLSNNVRIN
tara:strand:- start:4598 stop:5584 length:987 start_codon:yes stop_codon:yes gene_type:complete